MEEVEVKWIHAIQVWWSWLWRTMAFVLPLSFLAGMFVGIAFVALGINIQEYLFIPQIVGGLIGLYFSIKILKKILNKTFNGYRVALIKVDSPSNIDA